MLFTVPPESASVGVFLEGFSSLLRETVICPQQLLIYGGFNFHIDDKADKGTTRLGELLDLFNLKQHVCLSTHKRGHILDLVIKRNETESALSLKNVTVVEQFISDHKAVCFNLSLRKPVNERSTVVSRKLKGSDFDAFNEMIISTGLSDGGVSHCIELLAKKYDVLLCKALDKLALKRTRTIVIRPNAPWYNEEIATQKRKRRRLERKWRSTSLEIDRVNYLEQCNVVNAMLYKVKEQHYSTVIQDNAHDSKLLFRTVDKLLQRNTDKRYPSANSDQKLTNAFADFFSAKIVQIRDELQVRKEPLGELTMEDFECTSCFSEFAMVANENVLGLIRASIKACALDPLPVSIMWKCYSNLAPVFRRAINLSLSSGVLPKELKIVLLLPLLKKVNADFEQFSNFHPMSNLKFLSKLIEKAVFVQSNNYLGENDLHESLQSACSIFQSTETAILIDTIDIMLSLDKGENVFLAFLDLSAAFDIVSHTLLLARLQKSFGIRGTVLRWFNSYLPDRTQFVNINEVNSTIRDLPVGVPQGSVLGPVLYLCILRHLLK